jgi:T5orf172 domain-containing protein
MADEKSPRHNNGSAFGFLYVMTNPYMPGIVKIGQTERHPAARAIELSDHTGVPGAFEVAYLFEVTDRVAAEREVHAALRDARVNPDREFFSASKEEARTHILKFAASYICERLEVTKKQPSKQQDTFNEPEVLVRCSQCRQPLRFSKLTKYVGGFCICGQEVAYSPGQDHVFRPGMIVPGLVLPRCGICRSRMLPDRDSKILRCSHPKCDHITGSWGVDGFSA